jgi:glucose 1-dehydrogenase
VVSQVAARQMVKQGKGAKLIFVSSVHEDIPFPEYTAYCASKGGVRMMMRNLAI